MSVNRKSHMVLAKVDPRIVVVDPLLMRPSDWDLKAIAEDLRAYVERSRLIKATPILRFIDGDLKLISGAPFIRAAQQAGPSLGVVVCMIEIGEENIGQLNLELTTATKLLDELRVHQPYQAIEMLNFARPLTAAEQRAIEEQILAFFELMSSHPELYGGGYLSIDPFEWDVPRSRVAWGWQRNDQEGQHLTAFLDLLRKINRGIVALKSWNGMSYSAMQQ